LREREMMLARLREREMMLVPLAGEGDDAGPACGRGR